MPIYEYQCRGCGNRSEVMQRVTDPPLASCDDCGGELKKLISAPAFQFKGSGWYVTDYAGKSGAKDTSKEADAGESKDKDAKKSDTSDSSAASGGEAAPKTSDSTGKTKSERIASGPES